MDWVEFFKANMIDYVTRGPNTKRGEVSVNCPWCAGDDPSHHLGINLTKAAYGCLRNPEHRGKRPAGLIAALLGCSFSQALIIEKQYTAAADPENLGDALTL